MWILLSILANIYFAYSKKLFEFYFNKIGCTRIAIVSKLTLRSFALSFGII